MAPPAAHDEDSGQRGNLETPTLIHDKDDKMVLTTVGNNDAQLVVSGWRHAKSNHESRDLQHIYRATAKTTVRANSSTYYSRTSAALRVDLSHTFSELNANATNADATCLPDWHHRHPRRMDWRRLCSDPRTLGFARLA